MALTGPRPAPPMDEAREGGQEAAEGAVSVVSTPPSSLKLLMLLLWGSKEVPRVLWPVALALEEELPGPSSMLSSRVVRSITCELQLATLGGAAFGTAGTTEGKAVAFFVDSCRHIHEYMELLGVIVATMLGAHVPV